ncbi:MAG: chemotaxis protein CheA [Methylococcaceae bacterium]
MNLDAAIETYRVESIELLDVMEHALLELEHDAENPECINAVFRTAHTIKGTGGIFGFDAIVSFTHELESVLDRVRNNTVKTDPVLIALLLECADHIRNLLEPVIAGEPLTETQLANDSRLKTGLTVYQEETKTAPPPASVQSEHTAATPDWHISLRFDEAVLQHGLDPISFFNYLNRMGEIRCLVPVLDHAPKLADIDPECCHLGFELSYRTEASRTDIENAFEFVRDDCVLHLVAPASPLSDYVQLLASFPEEHASAGTFLLRTGTLTPTELEHVLNLAVTPQAVVSTHQNPSEPASLAPSVHDPATADKNHKTQEKHFIRIDSERLQSLIDRVGELVIAGSNTHLLAKQAGLLSVVESAANLTRLIEEIRNNALGLQMVQIGSTFQRFERVVHDVSKELGKEIELILTGGDTELDKSVVEQISDPLMHLVRNAMDHGIEPVEERLALGKTRHGTVSLNAYHDSGSIVLEVSDNGHGLNRDKILTKAKEKGIRPEAANPTDADVYALIFEPGFSTADTVSNLSGRGVGLDVVKRNVEALRGEVHIESEPGYGSRVRIRLPLTLAIIDGFLVRVGAERYVIPMDMLVECLEHTGQSKARCARQGYLDVRGEVLPVIRLADWFGLQTAQASGRENIAVVRYGQLRAGLIVDELLGEFQTVIKPLGALFSRLGTISGSTILGSGEVALIIDVPGLISHVMNHRERASAHPEVADSR